jgi:hypothetical protein
MKKPSKSGHPVKSSPQNFSAAWLVTLALGLPVLAGCPGQLDDLDWARVDAGRAITLPTDNVVDAAPAPAVAPPVAQQIDAAPPPSRPDARAVDAAKPADAARPADAVAAAPPRDPNAPDTSICAQPEAISAMILQPKCGTAGCHAKIGPAAGLDLVTPGAKGRMLAANAVAAACPNQPLATAQGTGVFFQKIIGNTCGLQMPLGTPPLSALEIACLQDWIKGTASAPPVSSPPPAASDGGAAPRPSDGGASPRPSDAGGGYAAPPGDPSCSTDEAITTMILKPYCTMCHSRATPSQQLDLESPGAKKRIVNIAAKSAGICLGETLAKTDGSGFFFDKLAGTMPNGCGAKMPFGSVLSQAQIQCLKDWVKSP